LHAKGCPISSHWQAQEDRHDLVQDTLRRFFHHFDRLRDLSPEAALRYLRFLWRRSWLNMTRRHQTKKRAAGREQPWTDAAWEANLAGGAVATQMSPLDSLIAGENQEQLTKTLAQLTERENRLLSWHAVDNLSFAEIGERLGLTEHAAQQRCRRICKRLARDLSAGT
jgi:RNA polymerase sigma factor (sigma-70 family)